MSTGREYLRVSFDRSGHQRSNEEQHDDNVAAAASFGVDSFGEPYDDVGSASKHQRKRRKDFDLLLDDLAHGRFGADVLVLWESSRGSRKVGEWVTLIDRCDEAGVKIMVTTHNRIYDPGNARDRRSMQEDAVDSEYESAKTSARTKRDAASVAAKGRPHGRVPYGYRRIYDPVNRKLVRQEPDPRESPVVKEMFTRFAAGHSLAAICRDFAARGITSRGSPVREDGTQERPGVPFSPKTLRDMLLAPVYRGKRVHTPGRSRNAKSDEATYEYDTKWWPALVTDDVFFAVRARLKDPARTTTRPGRAKHLLSMTARCGVCDGPLVGTYRYGPRCYQCQSKGHVTIDADQLDWAETEVFRLLIRPDLVERLMPEAVDEGALADARDEVARVRAEHADLVALVHSGKLSPTLAAGAEPGILSRLKLAEDRVSEMVTPSGLRDLIYPGSDVVEQWAVMPIEAKREAIRLLFVPGVLGKLTVAKIDGDRSVRARIRLDGVVPLRV